MRILYLFTSPAQKGSAVQQKVLNQIRYLNQASTICRGAFFSGEVKEAAKYSDEVDLIPVKGKVSKLFRKRSYRTNLDLAMMTHLSKVYADYDVFYLRYPLASKGLLEIARKFGKKIVLEHQTKEIAEMMSLIRHESFRPKLGYLFYLYEYGLLSVWTEYHYGRKILSHVRGGIAVTTEIAEYEQKRYSRYKCLVVGNGIELHKYPVTGQSAFDGRHLNLFVLIGANTSSPTHGVDRLIKSVKLNGSKFYITLSIFSKNKYLPEKGDNFEIKYEGFVSNEILNDKLRGMHFAVGGLTSFRKAIVYGSALKVREYFARGFPILMANIDEDINRNENARKYVISVPNVEAAIDFREIENKIEKILFDNERSQNIRNIAVQHFSIGVKMQQLRDSLNLLAN